MERWSTRIRCNDPSNRRSQPTARLVDPLAVIFSDPDHSIAERRELIIGESTKQRLLIVSFTDRNGRVRIIAARKVTAGERHDYEQNSKKNTKD